MLREEANVLPEALLLGCMDSPTFQVRGISGEKMHKRWGYLQNAALKNAVHLE